MAGNVSYYKIILCYPIKSKKNSEMNKCTQKTVLNYEKFDKVIRIC